MKHWWWLWRRRRRDEQLDEEIRFHLDMARRDRIERGETPEEAGRGARREFGNVTLVKEVTREMWGWTSVERLWQDVRYAARTLRQSPGFAATAMLSLGLGIGANTASFSLADALLLRPLPIHEPSAVFAIHSGSPEKAFEEISHPDFQDIRQKTRSFEGVVGYGTRWFALARSADAAPQMRMGRLVSSGFFSILGVQPALGRGFTVEETTVPGRDPVVILSHELWRSQFGADAGVVGETVRLNGIPFVIVGVAPERFTGTDLFMRPALYVPLSMVDRLSASPGGSLLERRGQPALAVKGRLRPGVTVEEAQAELTILAKALEQAFPETNRARTFTLRTELQARSQEGGPSAVVVPLLMALAGVVLIVACANVASLLLARARSRSREIAIRLAIGAGRRRLLQQLLTESVVLALCGGLAGLALAHGAIRFLASIRIPTDTPLVVSVRLDDRVLVFSLLASVVSALLFGLLPAWRTVRSDLASALKSGDLAAAGRARQMGRQVLVAGQVALSLVLLVTSAALLDAFRKMLVLDPGIRTDHVMMMEFDPSILRHPPGRTRQFYGQLLERARMLPGVRSATLARAIPFRPNFTDEAVVPEGYEFRKDQLSVTVASNVVEEQYFRTMGTEIQRGRGFTSEDTAESRRVAVVNQEFAKRYWPGQDPVGKRFRLGVNGPHLEVVGIARTAKYLTLAEAPQPYFYLPFSQNPRTRMTLLVETAGEPLAMTDPLLQVVRSLDANQPVYNIRALDAYYQQGVLGPARMALQMVGSTGLAGLALALIGLYGLVAYSVSRRTREIGIRVALGASRWEVLRLILRQGLGLSLAGALAGVALSVPVFRLLAAGLAGLGALSPWTLVIVPAGLILVALSACCVPARRASRIEPTVALRYE